MESVKKPDISSDFEWLQPISLWLSGVRSSRTPQNRINYLDLVLEVYFETTSILTNLVR